MKTNIGSINNRYSQELKAKKWEDFKDNVLNVIMAVAISFFIGTLIAFIYIR